ncbi:MAG TPA: hypothetical protein GX699_05020 [Firmicutes bacterium]|nr:hypothetical protein [Bacillota bacterium]
MSRVKVPLVQFWQKTVSKLSKTGCLPQEAEEKTFLAKLDEVCRDWQAAYNYFNMASGQEQIDLAISMLTTVERKFVLLLREAQLSGYQIPVTLEGLQERRGFYA